MNKIKPLENGTNKTGSSLQKAPHPRPSEQTRIFFEMSDTVRLKRDWSESLPKGTVGTVADVFVDSPHHYAVDFPTCEWDIIPGPALELVEPDSRKKSRHS